MKIETIHSFLVYPDRGKEEQSNIAGTMLPLAGSLYQLLNEIFINSIQECEYDIIFDSTDGVQENTSKDLLVNYTLTPSIENGRLIAQELQKQTTKVSGLGLLFLMVGKASSKYRLVVSRFAADQGIIAEEGAQTLTVKFVEQIFMKNAKAYKAVVYQGTNPESHFWEGKAIDKQINNSLNISEYWIKRFLKSDFSTTSERGTQRLAEILKSTINNESTPLKVKEELTASLKLAEGQNNQMVSIKTYLGRLGVSTQSKECVIGQTKESIYQEKFKLNYDELCKYISFKTIELDNGAILSAQTTDFNEVFDIKEEGDNVTYKTNGKIIRERVKKSKR